VRSCARGAGKGWGTAPEYLALLRDYARGERAAAIAGLGALGQRDLERQLGEVQRLVLAAEQCRCRSPLEGLPLRAAVMLHADRDSAEQPVSSEPEQPRPCPGWQARLAGRYAALLARLPDTRDFARRFFLAMAQRCQWTTAWRSPWPSHARASPSSPGTRICSWPPAPRTRRAEPWA